MSDINDTLTERGERYGTLYANAAVAQRLKQEMRATPNWARMAPDQKEALDMLASKISRLLTGDPNHGDSWHDIAGYAKLVEDRLIRTAEQVQRRTEDMRAEMARMAEGLDAPVPRPEPSWPASSEGNLQGGDS